MLSISRAWVKRIAIVLILGAGLGVGYYFFSAQARQSQEFKNIVPFEYDRDAEQVKQWFYDDWFWLNTPPGEYDVDLMLKERVINQDPRTAGTLNIYVLREDNQLMGFAAYYMEASAKGRMLFILVNPEARGKKIGEKLVRFVTKQLWDLGAQQILIFTRTSNHRAQRLYLRCGYKELTRWDGYMYFIMKRPS